MDLKELVFVLVGAVLVAWTLGSQAQSADHMDAATKEVCAHALNNKKLGVLLGQFPAYWPEIPSDYMMDMEVKPTAAERSALRTYVDGFVTCNSAINKVLKAASPNHVQHSDDETRNNLLLRLTPLFQGTVTYAEYFRQAQKSIDEITCAIDDDGDIVDVPMRIDYKSKRVNGAAAYIAGSEIRWSVWGAGMMFHYTINRYSGLLTIGSDDYPVVMRASCTLGEGKR